MRKPLKMLRLILAQDVFLPSDFAQRIPLWARLAHKVFIFGAPRFRADKRAVALSAAIAALGPSYIKLGQFLSTRADMIGETLAQDLSHLQDRLPPFPDKDVEAALQDALGAPELYFTNLSAPIAAASIAQVHQAQDPHDPDKKYAVKILRPHIERTLTKELKGFMRLARFCERFIPATRRLRPCASIEILQKTMTQEVDLRMEAAALSEMAENIASDTQAHKGFRVPQIIWQASRKNVLVMEWIEGVPISDITALKKAGHDLPALSQRLIEIFLTLALRDGFFHADMHQGNILVEADGTLVGIDLGITGRLDEDSRHFLAEILYGFITRDYRRVAEVHYRAGYVPSNNNIEDFAQALRAIGEPIRDRAAADISMAHLLAQLFAVTARFNMETQPQLLLLQKTMVNVEGVARSLYPQINFWDAAEPIVKQWLETELGLPALIKHIQTHSPDILYHLRHLPQYFASLEKMTQSPPVHSAPTTKNQTPLWLMLIAALVLFFMVVMALIL